MSFEVGDKVIDLLFGEGIVVGASSLIRVKYKECSEEKVYYPDGRSNSGHLYPLLYHAEGFTPPSCKEPERKPKCQLKPFDKILVRDGTNDRWRPTIFGKLLANGRVLDLNNVPWSFYIHYEGNEDKCWKVTKE